MGGRGRGGAGGHMSMALEFWIAGGVMVLASVEWPNPFGTLFWFGLLTGFLGFLFGMRS